MSVTQYILGIVAALVTLAIVIEMLRRRHLRERHAIWWIGAGIVALLISVFPGMLQAAAHLFGFSIPVNLVFFASLFILFLVALQHSTELTRLEDQNRKLVERMIELELRLEDLEQKNKR